jgi:hypothetical protein
MSNVRRLRRAVRTLAAVCVALAFIGAYTIAFAQEYVPNAADGTHTNIALGR